jgi:hypothetical protein
MIPPAVERTPHIRPLGWAHQPLGAEQQLLTPTAQRHTHPFTDRDDDVREAILEFELADLAGGRTSSEIAVQRGCELAFREEAQEARHAEVGAQQDPGEEIRVGVLGCRGAEQECRKYSPRSRTCPPRLNHTLPSLVIGMNFRRSQKSPVAVRSRPRRTDQSSSNLRV